MGELPQSILKFIPADMPDSCYGIVMELLEGGNLDKAVHPKASYANAVYYSLVERIRILAKLAKAIADFHEAGFVHSDLKPPNIFLSDRNASIIRLGDFGQSIKAKSAKDQQSATYMSATIRGTPVYSAPEMLVVPSWTDCFTLKDAMVVATSRKTDMYAFGVICWEVLCKKNKRPYYDNTFSAEAVVENDLRPSFEDLFDGVPDKIKSMMSNCWDKNRRRRLTALECYIILDQYYNTLTNARCDIFLSHLWSEKHYVRHIKHRLSSFGYRVWYDQDNMDHSLVDSMKGSIDNSKAVLVCLHRKYFKSANCMLELNHALSVGKSIFVLVTDTGVWDVPPKGWVTQDMRVKLGLHGQGNLFIDISAICSNPRWASVSPESCISKFNPFKCNNNTGFDGDEFVPIELKANLHAQLDDLIRILRQYSFIEAT